MIARERDLAAALRDRAAAERDREADQRDAEIASTTAAFGTDRVSNGHPERANAQQIVLRTMRDRQRAAAARARAAGHRAEAARDREDAATDRLEAAEDRTRAMSERDTAAVDELTGARRRAPGLAELQHEIDRAGRTTGKLVVAYVDVNGLKALNDADGHEAGDAMLQHVVGVLRARLRSYELIVRVGGDEFVCALSGATIEDVRRRFDDIGTELAVSGRSSIAVGFAELAADDSPADLISRADADLLATRTPGRPRVGVAPERVPERVPDRCTAQTVVWITGPRPLPCEWSR